MARAPGRHACLAPGQGAPARVRPRPGLRRHAGRADQGDPYALEVVVTVDGKERYRGSTAEIDHKAEDVFAWLGFIASIQPGTVVGMGTIPDCTGLDHDDFVDPGAGIEIRFDRLGSLRCRFAEPARKLLPSRWPLTPAQQKFHGA